VLLTEGCRIGRAKIQDSVIGLRSIIEGGCEISSTIVMGNDYYENSNPSSSNIPMGVGPNCVIEGAILDKNVRIGSNVVIKPFPRGTDIDTDMYVVRDGIVVIPKRTIIPDGTIIAP
jgi:glucose-1-phosphate adenylyltransferase